MSWYARRKKLLVETFADLQATQRPEMTEVQSSEDAPIAKIGICKDLREQPVNQGIKIEGVHNSVPLIM